MFRCDRCLWQIKGAKENAVVKSFRARATKNFWAPQVSVARLSQAKSVVGQNKQNLIYMRVWRNWQTR